MSAGPNEPRPDYLPWIVAGALLALGLGYVTYVHPALAVPLTVAMGGVALLAGLVRR